MHLNLYGSYGGAQPCAFHTHLSAERLSAADYDSQVGLIGPKLATLESGL